MWFLFYKQHPWCQAFPRSHKYLKDRSYFIWNSAVRPSLPGDFLVCFKIYRFDDSIERYFRFPKIKVFITYFLSVRNFAKKFIISNCGSFLGVRNSRLEVLYKNGVLKNPVTLLKKKFRHRWFPVKFTNFLRTPFFTELVR